MSDGRTIRDPVYQPAIFDVNDLGSAMAIILTPEGDTTTQERWETETPYLIDEIGQALNLNDNSCVLDYGCGVGRIAKGLIERFNCAVLGVDISQGMRQLAPGYVNSVRFAACAPALLDRMIAQGFRATHACACWVIQHCLDPDKDLARIDAALAGNGKLFVLNSSHRYVPTDHGWASDGLSVEDLLDARFERIAKRAIPAAITTPEIANTCYMTTLRKRG